MVPNDAWDHFGTCVGVNSGYLVPIPSLDSEIDIEGQIPVQVMVAFAVQETQLLLLTILVHVLTLLRDVIRYPVLWPWI